MKSNLGDLIICSGCKRFLCLVHDPKIYTSRRISLDGDKVIEGRLRYYLKVQLENNAVKIQTADIHENTIMYKITISMISVIGKSFHNLQCKCAVEILFFFYFQFLARLFNLK